MTLPESWVRNAGDAWGVSADGEPGTRQAIVCHLSPGTAP
jgi:hypothetical protein